MAMETYRLESATGIYYNNFASVTEARNWAKAMCDTQFCVGQSNILTQVKDMKGVEYYKKFWQVKVELKEKRVAGGKMQHCVVTINPF